MKSSLRPTTPDDLGPIRQILRRAFNAGEDAPFLDPAVMRWKYWDRRDDWDSPRAWVLERDGVITAHVGLWPMSFGALRGVQMIDWASSRESPGAGLAVVQKLDAMFDFIYSIGGSEMTCRILPALGFREWGRQWRAARPLRPLRQIMSHQHRNWKLAARLFRNTGWSMGRSSEGAADEIGPGEFAGSIDRLAAPRDPGFFEYLLRCPAMKTRLCRITDGHFVIGVLRGQARMGGIWLRDANRDAWRAAYAIAQQTAAQMNDAIEIVAAGTEGPSADAATISGLRTVRHVPIYLLNREGKLDLPPDFQFQLCDDDTFFLDAGRPDYWT